MRRRSRPDPGIETHTAAASTASRSSASAVTSNAPTKARWNCRTLIPSIRYRPNPPRLAYAATVAVATICRVAVRSPPRINGIAVGISTRVSTRASVIPIDRAASTTFGSTLAMPA